MQAVILAAGEGMRLRPLTDAIPKCLLKVGKKTILEHIFSQLPQEIHEVVLVVGHLKGEIKKQIGTSNGGRRIQYIEQTERLGTGHALSICKDVLNDSKFLVLMGDNLYFKKDIENCLRHDLCLLAQKLESPERFGVLRIEDGILRDIIESPKLSVGTLVNCGLYVLDKRIFDYPLVSIGLNEYGLPQTIVKMSNHHPVGIEKANFWLSINTVQDLKQADKYLKKIYV
ncbi:MAG: Glucose-1-phosphate thymidylyltransferase [Candidatus Jorgensenbacteria bacterium GW2011_GWA1_48_13]|uniref:Glucose-1-phosphate thymidylyltransferase n=2 Tax=Candidatus Joergenseniibacteriota TaxID=1752739 RepID=A0A0G1YKC5_9BACT|nr:MAG: Glucose-1-phosphate thymidylyltransferase [Candidatus Jorgensenbacteria bacterium GW2011_GWA1_48_13]KKU99118.1 MAG: Glucose-1-phosphate thymidylyltransferase [Candidatus Jorgensenbacteria bacterium GW2011_GWC1_48_8]KKW15472.1 MAG: Glucose-1-phosphate thymidylyltransferase [Candidatus Jorgensenbacteria bacterium GW2011_GWB1_50_10]